MDESKFKELYTKEYTEFIKSSFPELRKVKKEFPEFLETQIGYYESLITNEADNIVLKTIIKYNVKLSDVFGEGYEQEFMLNKLILKCWSIQTSIRKRVFDAFVSAELY